MWNMGCGPSRNVEDHRRHRSARDISAIGDKCEIQLDKIENGKTVVSIDSRTANDTQTPRTHESRTKSDEIANTPLESGTKRCLTILHFNDVYNIEPREKEPVGGAARFATKLASFRYLNPLTIFSGDALNPSLMSSVTRGKQMIPVLNSMNIDIAVYGNHDFDFGVDELIEFNNATNFPWLLSNVIDLTTKEQLAEGEVKKIMEWGGKKIGFIGLVEKEWLVTLATVDPEEVEYRDFVSEGTKLAKELREEGAEFVIALTHMRVPNDHRLARESSGIDLILGGHDHHYETKEVNGIQVIKSGSDFREFSVITVSFGEDNNYTVDVERIEVNGAVSEDPHVKATVDKYLDGLKESMEEVLGDVEVELDGRFASIRTGETNLGNFITDIMCHVSQADVTLLNSGTLRSDTLHSAGEFKMKDLVAILPMPDSMVTLSVTGEQLLEALENGVSQWPKHEGRFPQISGVCFAFDASAEPGKRVIEDSIKIAGEALQKDKHYKLCTKAYIAKGKDGYDVFAKAQVLVNEEEGPILPAIVQNHFISVNILRGMKKSRSGHRQSIVTRHGESLDALHDLEKKQARINPKIEGRITIINGGEGFGPTPAAKTEIHEDCNQKTSGETAKNKRDIDQTEPPPKPINDSCQSEDSQTQRTENETTPVAVEKESENNGKEVVSENIAEAKTEEILDKTEENKDENIEPDLATEDEYWDLWEAVKVDDINTVERLHQEKHIRLTRYQDNKTILHLGAERNAVKVLQYLLLQGKVDANVTDAILQGVPLHGAAECGSVDAARTLLQHGTQINKQDLIGNTALHIACEHEQAEMKTFLVKQGADTTLVNSDGQTPAL